MSNTLFLLLMASATLSTAAENILVFGDSLSAGYGMASEQGWPSLLQKRLRDEHMSHTLDNASISGETTAGGRARFAAALKRHQPAIVILALGANDGLQGLPLDTIRANLIAMVRAAKTAAARVLLVGMRLPPNYGPGYTQGFERLYADVAHREKTALLPFLLEPIAFDENAFQADRIHPVAASQPLILDHVWHSLTPLLKPR